MVAHLYDVLFGCSFILRFFFIYYFPLWFFFLIGCFRRFLYRLFLYRFFSAGKCSWIYACFSQAFITYFPQALLKELALVSI